MMSARARKLKVKKIAFGSAGLIIQPHSFGETWEKDEYVCGGEKIILYGNEGLHRQISLFVWQRQSLKNKL